MKFVKKCLATKIYSLYCEGKDHFIWGTSTVVYLFLGAYQSAWPSTYLFASSLEQKKEACRIDLEL